MNGPEAQIIGLEWMRDGHRFDDTAGKRWKSQAFG